MAALLFGAAGSLSWAMGWAYLGIFLLAMVANALLADPELIAERLLVKRSTEGWDNALMGVYGLISVVAVPLVAGLDRRYGWPGGIGLGVQVAGMALNTLGWVLNVWSMMANKFFSTVVRVQDDRGQTVATGGPYRLVRHPGYVGAIAFVLGSALMLGSLWATLLGVVGVLLMVVRTALEDRLLQERLAGYREYAARVRYRLLPGVW